MRLSRRAPAAVAVAALLTIGLVGCTSDDEPGGDSARVVIGADLNSGSAVDTAYARALNLRIEQLNASGTLGDRKVSLRILDNQSDPTTSLRNIAAFGDDSTVAAVVMGSCSECVVGAAKTINDKRIPTIALAPADNVTTPLAERKYIFKIGPNSPDSAAALVATMGRSDVDTVAVLYSSDLYGKAAQQDFAAQAAKSKIQIKNSVAVKPTATDVTQAVGTLADSEPEALVLLVGPDQAGLAATSAKTAKFAGRMYFDAASASDLFIPQKSAAATENATMVFTQTLAIDDVIATTPAKATRKQWFRDYTSRYGAYSGVASLAADALDVIGDSIMQVGTDRATLRGEIETAQIDGLSGSIRITPANHSGLMPQALALLVARSGRWRLVS